MATHWYVIVGGVLGLIFVALVDVGSRRRCRLPKEDIDGVTAVLYAAMWAGCTIMGPLALLFVVAALYVYRVEFGLTTPAAP